MVSIADSCGNFPSDTGGGTGYTYLNPKQSFQAGGYNPMNGSQIVYFIRETPTFSTHILDMQKNIDITLTAPGIYTPTSWNSLGWIALDALNGLIYKIKDNGDSFMVVPTSTTNNTAPCWSPDGKKIVFNGSGLSSSGVCIINADGTGLEAFDAPHAAGDPVWSRDGSKISYTVGHTYIGYTDTLTKQSFNLASSTGGYTSWFPDNKTLVWADTKGMFKINIYSRKITTLRTSCPERGYSFPCVSPDGSRILFTRTDSKYIPVDKDSVTLHVCVMDSAGNNEYIIK